MDLYFNHQIARLDQLCMQHDQQSSAQLMLRAARSVWKHVQRRWPDSRHILVLAGSGNNGGDAFALALLAMQDGCEVSCLVKGNLHHQSDESRWYRDQWEQAGGNTEAWQGELPDGIDMIIDGLLGIGLKNELNDEWQNLIQQVNEATIPKIAIDIPSGLNANTGNPMPVAIHADLTVTFIARKLGCYVSDGPDYCGEIEYESLGISTAVESMIQPAVSVLEPDDILLPQRDRRNTHKNQFGHVLVVGGSQHMSGAVRLAGMAALRMGSGLVSLSVTGENRQLCAMANAELMVSDWSDLSNQLEHASVIVVGPGLGRSAEAQQILAQLHQCELPMVVDADALQVDFVEALSASQSIVLTPHPGEAARLLDTTSISIQQDRLQAVQELNQRYGSVTVLKGSGTLVADNQSVSLCNRGNSGLSTAGSGDVLAGIIASLIGQGMTASEASSSGVLIHAMAAETYSQYHDTSGLVASDLIDLIPRVVLQLRRSGVIGG